MFSIECELKSKWNWIRFYWETINQSGVSFVNQNSVTATIKLFCFSWCINLRKMCTFSLRIVFLDCFFNFKLWLLIILTLALCMLEIWLFYFHHILFYFAIAYDFFALVTEYERWTWWKMYVVTFENETKKNISLFHMEIIAIVEY